MIAFNLVDEGYVDARKVINHKDPFHAECRAYGRLNETNRTDLAVRCYGYVSLTSAQEAALERFRSICDDWDRCAEHTGVSLKCIIKEYIDSDTFFNRAMVPRMRRNIKDLNKVGIIVYDVRKENFLDGIIIDFSQAYTVPHLELDIHSDAADLEEVYELCARDYACFDTMMDEWNIMHPGQPVWQRFISNRAFGRRLRNNDRYRKPLYEREGARLDALKYNWNGRPPKRNQYRKLAKKG